MSVKPPAPRLPRIPKGRRPRYARDPASDRLLEIALTLAGELAVTRERLDSVEALLVRARVLRAGSVDAFTPKPDDIERRRTWRESFVARVLRGIEADLAAAQAEADPALSDAERRIRRR